jgi:hypothetical protein
MESMSAVSMHENAVLVKLVKDVPANVMTSFDN